MKQLYIFLLWFFALFLFCEKVEAQPTINIDTSFNIGIGFNNEVRSVALQPDGKVLVGGYYTEYNGQAQNRIARLNTDGSLDTSFEIGTGFNNSYVVAITLQPDGKVLVGGSFTSYNGQTQNRIARLNTDGSLDTSFNIGVGFNDFWVHEITLQPDGKILVGGSFTQYNGQTQNRIVRLNTDGSLDTSFATGTGFNDWVETITLQSDGKILVGGNFTSYNGQSRNSIVRLNTDGSLDTSFNIGTGFNISEWSHSVGAIVLQPDGKILIGGSFVEYNGQTQKSIVRLNMDGSVDTSFNSEAGFYTNNANGVIYTMALQPDGKILVGGTFTRFGTQTQGRISRLNSDGSLDTSFKTGTGFNGYVTSIILQPDGKILAGGGFAYYNGQSQRRIARLYELVCEITPPTPEAVLIPIPCSLIPEDAGTLVVTYPLGEEYQYSIDGVNYQSSPVFPNVWDFGTFQLTVKQGSCVSDPLEFSNIEQSTDPIADVTQPNCSDIPESGQFGMITVTFPLGDMFQYSIDGVNYQDSPVFFNVLPDTYELTFRYYESENCVSDPFEVSVFALDIPDIPTAIITQPTCDNPFGSIEVIKPVGDAFEFSINGTDYLPSHIFENLPNGTYQVTVRKGDCVSESLEVNINFPPAVPETPVVNVIQPTCENPFGSIEVISPVDNGDEFTPNYEYSINGVDYYEFTLFDNLSSGVYYVMVRHLTSGCISDSLEVIIDEFLEISINLVTVCENENRFMLKAETQEQNYQYVWNTGETTPEIEISEIGEYSVIVSLGNCSEEFFMNIDAIPCMIPKGISPNGDFKNDDFDLSGFGTVNRVQIFNRYGTNVYSQSNYTNQWKGQTNHGKELPTGIYYYLIYFRSGTTKTGWIYLNRG